MMAACVTTSGPVNAVWKLFTCHVCLYLWFDPEDGGNIFIRNFRVNLKGSEIKGSDL